MSGSGSLTKIGSGTLTLTATNTYSGSTTISVGTIKLGNPAVPAGYAGYYSFDNVSGTAVINGGSGGATYNGTLTSASGTAAYIVGGSGVRGSSAMGLSNDPSLAPISIFPTPSRSTVPTRFPPGSTG